MISRRKFLLSAAVVAGGSALLRQRAFGSKKVGIGVLPPAHCSLPAAHAESSGLFRKAGLNAEVVFMKDIKEILQGVASGKIDFGQLTSPLIFAANAGAPGMPKTSLSALQALGTNGGALAVSAKSEIKKLSDLKGKRIGVHSPLIVHSMILGLLIEKSGLDIAKDIEMKVVPMEEMASALEDGRIDAIINPEPIPAALEAKGISRTLLLTKMFWVDHPCCMLVTRRQTLGADTNLAADLTRACMTAGLELESPMRAKAIAGIHEKYPAYQKMPLQVMLKAFSSERSGFYPFPFKSAGEVIVSQMKKQGVLGPEADASKLVSESFESEFALGILKEAAKDVPGSRIPSGVNRPEKISLT